MLKIIFPEEDECKLQTSPEPPLVVQVMSAKRVVSVFFPEQEEPVLRWSSNPFYCVWKAQLLGHFLEISVVEGLWFDEVVRRCLFIHSDEKVLWWISVPSTYTRDLDLHGTALDIRREPVWGTLYA